MDDKEAELIYGKPDSETIQFSDTKCEHFFIRKNSTDIECSKCHSGWPNLALHMSAIEGKLVKT